MRAKKEVRAPKQFSVANGKQKILGQRVASRMLLNKIDSFRPALPPTKSVRRRYRAVMFCTQEHDEIDIDLTMTSEVQ